MTCTDVDYSSSKCPFIPFEPARDETYNKTCATSKDSDQPAHPRGLISVFADRTSRISPGYPKRDK